MADSLIETKNRKIIHIDMDCFYAAVEIRDQPHLKNKPVAVGGSPDERGVLCTCNYIARKWGVRSAMATSFAKRLCPGLIVLPVNMKKYRNEAGIIHSIFQEFTSKIEPLSLDEAYLDVSASSHCQGSGTLMAQAIRQQIWNKVQLTASAGVAPNKFLAKIASGWNKPNGLFVIPPKAIPNFIKELAVTELFGVGKVTANKLHRLGIKTCADLQNFSLGSLIQQFGKFGQQLYEQSHGIDNRPVEPNRIRKSISVEHTFRTDISIKEASENLAELYDELLKRIKSSEPGRIIKNQFIKVKFSNFKQTTLEKSNQDIDLGLYKTLLNEISNKNNSPIRLLGLGVHFMDVEKIIEIQQSLFI